MTMMEATAVENDAVVNQAANIVESRELRTLAVLTSSKTAARAKEFVKIVTEKALQPFPSFSIVSMDTIPREFADTSSDASLRVALHDDLLQSESLKLDGCFDLICTESSLKFATRHVEPLGTLILSAPPDLMSAIAIDMNAVVVNELVLMHVGGHRAESPRELELVTAQAISSV